MRTGGAELDAFGVGNEKECAPGKVLVGAGEVALGAGKEKVGVEVVGGLATGAAPKLKEENAPLPLAGAAEDDAGVGRAPKGLDDTATGPKLPPPRAANGFFCNRSTWTGQRRVLLALRLGKSSRRDRRELEQALRTCVLACLGSCRR